MNDDCQRTASYSCDTADRIKRDSHHYNRRRATHNGDSPVDDHTHSRLEPPLLLLASSDRIY